MDCAVCFWRGMGAGKMNLCCACTDCCWGRCGQRRCGFHTPPPPHTWVQEGYFESTALVLTAFSLKKPSCFFQIFFNQWKWIMRLREVAECTFTLITCLWNHVFRLWLVNFFLRHKCHWTFTDEAWVYSHLPWRLGGMCFSTRHPLIFKNGTRVSVQVWQSIRQPLEFKESSKGM